MANVKIGRYLRHPEGRIAQQIMKECNDALDLRGPDFVNEDVE